MLIFERLDAKSLQVAACVCRRWSEAAMKDELWKNLCLSKWPSLAEETGLLAVQAAGKYHKFYSLRSQARLFLTHSHKLKPLNPRLLMEDLIFFLDITHKESTVFSFTRGGEFFHPIYFSGEDSTFCFKLPLQELSFKSCLWKSSPQTSPTIRATVPACSQKWSKNEMKELNVSWAVMVKGSSKILQLLDAQGSGHVMGSICNYADTLPAHFCCTLAGSSNEIAEVDLFFRLSHSVADDEVPEMSLTLCPMVVGDEDLNKSKCFELNELRLSIMNTSSWRYLTLTQALHYFQLAFLHNAHFKSFKPTS
ncbi:hypothetical protein O6H91_07G037000 [Diphasiastrum complanatum]|nr:hypothetical protein O6H91_Y012400 [Diphasiastrum complanatum]KAJ7549024.1 hypothetical protein O6H91_07G037000 [Diphasiastrum complanatum]